MDFTPILIWIFMVGVGAILVSYLIKEFDTETFSFLVREGFSNESSETTFKLNSCPLNSTSYITANGDTECCSVSDIVNKQCNGDILCSLSSSPKSGVDTCSAWLSKEWKKRSTKFCPSTMPNYYGPVESKVGSSKRVEGCSSEAIKSDGTAPQALGGSQCKIYETSEDEYGKSDSCLNLKALESVSCPTKTAEKSILESDKGLPALLACSFVPPNNSSPVPVVCYQEERAKVYMKAKLGGDWEAKLKEKSMALNTMLSLCGTSKNYYIDGSVAAKDVKF
uniref:Uncharacterized protein n=1 Tax=viral metagenome TaxID=1070528 RepID=A0A6C0LPK9_9ZZZZ